MLSIIRRIGRLFSVGRDVKPEVRELLQFIFEGAPHLGLDVDGTLDVDPGFFSVLTHVWPGKVTIITLRGDSTSTREYIGGLGVRFDDLVSVRFLEDKVGVIVDRGVDVFVDDQDEALVGVPEGVTVLKIRDVGGNFEGGRWLFSDRTGRRLV